MSQAGANGSAEMKFPSNLEVISAIILAVLVHRDGSVGEHNAKMAVAAAHNLVAALAEHGKSAESQ